MNPFDSVEVLALMRRYLFCTICTILSLLLIAAIWILWQDVHTLEALNRERTQEGQAMLSTMVSGPLIRQELARAQEIVQRIDKSLMIESRLEENVGYFYKIQSQTKADVVYLRPQNADSNNDSDYRVIPFTLQLAGTYEQVANYLLALETGPRFVQIKFFSFKRRQAGADSLTLSLDLKMLGKR